MLRVAILVAATLACAGCGRQRYSEYASSEAAMIAPMSPAQYEPAAAAAAAADAAASASAAPRTPGVNVPAGPPMLAYAYSYGLSVPVNRVAELKSRHEAACTRAGHQQCQVVSSSLTDTGQDAISGELVMRAAPAWLQRFREGLADEARSAGGRVIRSEVTSEDLSRQIVDVEAALKAKTTLRDRLQALLASRPGKVSDLLEVERELARVQQEIDSAQSQLAVMRGRVATSEITVSYESETVLAPAGVWRPLTDALGGFLRMVAMSLGSMVLLLGALLPWTVLLGVLYWIFRKRLPKPRWPFRRRRPPPV